LLDERGVDSQQGIEQGGEADALDLGDPAQQGGVAV
jgi:hypothetical protein